MSELVIQEAVSLIPQAVAQLGRIRAITHAAKVVVEALGILFAGAPKPIALPIAINGFARLMSSSSNVEVPDGSVLVVLVGNDHYPTFSDADLAVYEKNFQSLVDGAGIKAKVHATNHAIDFRVICFEKVITKIADGNMSVTTTATAQPK